MTTRSSTDPGKPAFAFLVPWDPIGPGGVIAVIANLYRQVQDDGEFEPILLVNRWSARRPTEEMVTGRRTVYFRTSSPWPSGTFLGFLKWLFASPLFFFDLWRLCRRYQVAVINVHYPSLGTFGPALLRALHLYRGRIVLSFHGLDLAAARTARPIDALAWRFILRHSDVAVAVSHAFAREVEEFTAGNAPVVVVHNGVDLDHLMQPKSPGPDRLARLNARPYVASVGKLEQRKGLDVLVRAFAELHRSDSQLALVLVGNPGDATDSLRALTTELGLDDDVFFFDAVPHAQVGEFLRQARVVCVPSRSETFGIVLLEAGAFRRPIVATRVGGIPEVIEDGESGLLVAPDDPAALASALARVLADESLANRLADRLFERVKTEFTWKQAFVEYKRLARMGPAPS